MPPLPAPSSQQLDGQHTVGVMEGRSCQSTREPISVSNQLCRQCGCTLCRKLISSLGAQPWLCPEQGLRKLGELYKANFAKYANGGGFVSPDTAAAITAAGPKLE